MIQDYSMVRALEESGIPSETIEGTELTELQPKQLEYPTGFGGCLGNRDVINKQVFIAILLRGVNRGGGNIVNPPLKPVLEFMEAEPMGIGSTTTIPVVIIERADLAVDIFWHLHPDELQDFCLAVMPQVKVQLQPLSDCTEVPGTEVVQLLDYRLVIRWNGEPPGKSSRCH
jgi:hypothetical protein